MITWTPEFSVGSPTLDDQHKEFFRIINELSDTIERGNMGDASFLIAQLEIYRLYHFSTEEHEMAKHDYPALDSHKAEHEKFSARLKAFKEKLQKKDSVVFQEFSHYLQNWLREHILDIDKKYGPYLKAKG